MRRGISASGLSVALLSSRGLPFSETGKQHVPVVVVLPRGTILHHQQACTHPMLSMVRSFLLSNGRMAHTSPASSPAMHDTPITTDRAGIQIDEKFLNNIASLVNRIQVLSPPSATSQAQPMTPKAETEQDKRSSFFSSSPPFLNTAPESISSSSLVIHSFHRLICDTLRRSLDLFVSDDRHAVPLNSDTKILPRVKKDKIARDVYSHLLTIVEQTLSVVHCLPPRIRRDVLNCLHGAVLRRIFLTNLDRLYGMESGSHEDNKHQTTRDEETMLTGKDFSRFILCFTRLMSASLLAVVDQGQREGVDRAAEASDPEQDLYHGPTSQHAASNAQVEDIKVLIFVIRRQLSAQRLAREKGGPKGSNNSNVSSNGAAVGHHRPTKRVILFATTLKSKKEQETTLELSLHQVLHQYVLGLKELGTIATAFAALDIRSDLVADLWDDLVHVFELELTHRMMQQKEFSMTKTPSSPPSALLREELMIPLRDVGFAVAQVGRSDLFDHLMNEIAFRKFKIFYSQIPLPPPVWRKPQVPDA